MKNGGGIGVFIQTIGLIVMIGAIPLGLYTGGYFGGGLQQIIPNPRQAWTTGTFGFVYGTLALGIGEIIRLLQGKAG